MAPEDDVLAAITASALTLGFAGPISLSATGPPARATPRVQAKSDGGSKKPPNAAEPPKTFETLAAQLGEPEPDRRRSAVRGLVELGTPQAWRLVLGALEDAESAVGDEAQ